MDPMPLTRRFFIWNAVSVLLSLGAAGLVSMIYMAIRTRWLGGQNPDKEGMPSADGGVPTPPAPPELQDGRSPAPLPISPDEAIDLYGDVALAALISFILVFIVLNLWVSSRFSRGIIAPVVRLRDAAVTISQGDLSGGIAEEGEGEVLELARSLEQMRIKLKESIYIQQRYDENRKFLLSSISHDLKTPVTAIRGYIEGILDGVAATPEKQQQYLEIACSKALQVSNMIDDLLLYSKLDLNQLPYHFEITDLRRYFEDCLEDYRYAYVQAGVELTLSDRLQKPVMIRIDRERFKRVMQNILDNALKHVPQDNSGGKVELILRETRTSAIIEVRDNGPGIPEEHLPHIFERFYRGDCSRTNAESSGLGLAIAKQIVEGHEGRIWAVSKPGEGTRMMISLRKL